MTKLINTEELSKITGIAPITWAKRRMRGEPHTPPYLKIGRSVKYRWDDVEKWLASKSCSSTSQEV
ncbi:helix-turn-helix transcriptional regulator [Hirschia baltica]|uniref:Helix-turn-helix domain-containing protein n=1 Tax=Hirschia baltica (strain ATCC 49814 / DSM 5838 / IFAM 1418) TaxID=582402 RepID=C6XR22_HIRBI|nr:hypothetical protein [Hirschia baltica]ACT60553.1 conserved hypothetical protein [Hirschia baltica ATCC 49814]